MDKRCVCSDYSIPRPLPISLPPFRPPYSLRHSNIEIRPLSNLSMASKFSSEKKSHTSLTLNQKLETIKLSEESISKG